MKHKGFTLAELLTTLTIIGVIATLTIPVAIRNTKEHQQKLALQKGIKTINEAISLNIAKGKGDLFTYVDRNSANNLLEYLSLNLDTVGGIGNTNITDSDADNYIETKDGIRFVSPAPIGHNGNKNRCGTHGTNLGGSLKIRETGPCVLIIDVSKSKNHKTKTDISDLSAGEFKIWLTDKSTIPSAKVERFLGTSETAEDISDEEIYYNNYADFIAN